MDSPSRPADRAVAAAARAYAEVPFYARKGKPFAEAEGVAAFAALPLLSRRELGTALPKAWVPAGRDLKRELEEGRLVALETPGTMGDRLRLLRDPEEVGRQREEALAGSPLIARALGGKPQFPLQEAFLERPLAGTRTCHTGDLPYEARTFGARLFLNQRPDPTFWLPQEMTRMLDELERHRTALLEADPVHLHRLARFAAAAGRRIAVTGAIVLTHGIVTAGALRALRAVFDGAVVEAHGAMETGVLHVEGDHGRLEPSPAHTFIELLPARVPTPGADGVAMVVVTTLARAVQPLVRYALADLVRVDGGGPEAAVGGGAAIVSVEGRLDDALLLPSGALVTAGALARALGSAEAIATFQATQDTPGHVQVDVVPEDGRGAEALAAARDALAPLLADVTVDVRAATAIAAETSGRFRVARRKIPLDTSAAFPTNGTQA